MPFPPPVVISSVVSVKDAPPSVEISVSGVVGSVGVPAATRKPRMTEYLAFFTGMTVVCVSELGMLLESCYAGASEAVHGNGNAPTGLLPLCRPDVNVSRGKTARKHSGIARSCERRPDGEIMPVR